MLHRKAWFGLFPFRSPLLRELCQTFNSSACFLFLWVLECFTSPGAHLDKTRQGLMSLRFPHSEISGSKVARHLPEAYRRHAASFIAVLCQGIHHMPLYLPLGNIKTTITFICYLLTMSLEKTWWLLLDVVSRTRLDTMYTTWLLAQSNNSTSNKRPRKKLKMYS